MPSFLWEFLDPDQFELEDEAVVLKGVLRLRRTDSTGRFDRGGTYKTGAAVLRTASTTQLDSLFGFETEDVEAGGEIRWQFSLDGGTTFLWHDGSDWVPASNDNEANTSLEVGANIRDLPHGRRFDVTPRVILESIDGSATPKIGRAFMHFEPATFEFEEDLVRSLKRIMDEEFEVDTDEAVKGNGTNRVPLKGNSGRIVSGVASFDITSDPDRTNDLFDFVDGDEIVLTDPVPSGNVVQTWFKVRPEVYLGADPDIFESRIPAYVIEIGNEEEERDQRIGQDYLELNRGTSEAKLRPYPVHMRADVILRCTTPWNRKALSRRMVQAAQKRLQQVRTFRSLVTDEPYDIIGFGPVTENDNPRDAVAEKDLAISIVGRNWAPAPFKTVPLAEAIEVGLGDFRRRTSTIEIK